MSIFNRAYNVQLLHYQVPSCGFYPLSYSHSAFLTFKPPLSFFPCHSISCIISPISTSPPPSFSIHPSKDTSTGSLSSFCWHKFEAYLYRPRANTNAKMHYYLAEGVCLMDSSGTKLMVIALSRTPRVCVCLFHTHTHVHAFTS